MVMKIGIGFIFVITFLFLGSAFAADPAPPPVEESCWPKFTFDTGPIVMTRHQGNKDIFSSPGRAGSGDLLKTSMVDDDWRVGGQARLSVSFPYFYLDFGGFWIPSGSDSVHKFVPDGENTIETSPPTFFGGPTVGDATFKYSSSIYGLDGNIGHSFAPWLSAYAGVRYMRLKEKLDLFSPFGDSDFEDDNWKTENTLVGPQIGAQGDILKLFCIPESSPWSLDTNVAVGYLHNHTESKFSARENEVYTSASSNFWIPSIAAKADLGYRLTRNLKLVIGYQMLYLDRVALATNAVSGTDNFNIDGRIGMSSKKDSVLYHGGIVRFVVELP
jgi:hypothetical protein